MLLLRKVKEIKGGGDHRCMETVPIFKDQKAGGSLLENNQSDQLGITELLRKYLIAITSYYLLMSTSGVSGKIILPRPDTCLPELTRDTHSCLNVRLSDILRVT